MPPFLHIMWNALYGAVNVVFALFGLKPVDGVYVLGGLFLTGLGIQVRMLFKERDSWTFDPDKTPRKRSP